MAQEEKAEDVVSNYKPSGKALSRVVFVRHGQSVWNASNYFTGWVDVDLTELGIEEAKAGAKYLVKDGFKFDCMYTSFLKRAQKTGDIILNALNQKDISIIKDWRLNERMYGNLSGQHKKLAFEEPLYDSNGNGLTPDALNDYLKENNLKKEDLPKQYTNDEIAIWRRVYDVPPPKIHEKNKFGVKNDEMYKDLNDNDKPETECLKDVVKRAGDYWNDVMVPDILKGKDVLVAAHGNSLRAILMLIENIPASAIRYLEVPTGFPLVYEFENRNGKLAIVGVEDGSTPLNEEQTNDPDKCFGKDKQSFPLRGQYMASDADVEAARNKVKNQIKQ